VKDISRTLLNSHRDERSFLELWYEVVVTITTSAGHDFLPCNQILIGHSTWQMSRVDFFANDLRKLKGRQNNVMQERSKKLSGKSLIPDGVDTACQEVIDPMAQLWHIIEDDLHILTGTQGTTHLMERLQQYNKRLRAVAAQCSAELNRREKSVIELLEFERMISNLSARFINIVPEEVNSEIHHALQRICEFFSGSLCGVLKVSPGGKPVQFTHIACSDVAFQAPLFVDVSGLYPWCFHKLMEEGHVINVSSSETLPPEAATDNKTMQEWNVRSLLFIPLVTGEKVCHILVISSGKSGCLWSEAHIPRLRLLGEIFINALDRTQAQEALMISEQRFRQFFKTTPDYCYILSPRGTVLNINNAALHVLGFQRDELVGKPAESIFSPESRTKIRDLISKLNKSGSIRNEEMVIITRNGEQREVILNAGILRDQNGTIMCSTVVQTDITDLKRSENDLREAYAEIKQLKDQLEAENLYLRKEMEQSCEFKGIIGESNVIKSVLQKVEQVAPTDSLVLITGETGTGKELIAQAIHQHSRRKDRVMVKINCASLPTGLVESELFGREKGAYTGALTRQMGRFELADASTIFLDEIGELSPEVQAKLLRVLQDGEFERLGSTKTIKVNTRIIAATNRDLAEAVRKGNFREDLYYRLNVFPIEVPPLRERTDDIPLLLWTFIEEFSEKMNRKIHTVPKGVIERMQHYRWPGNIREMRNVIEQAVIVSMKGILQIQLPKQPYGETCPTLSLEEAESQHIIKILEFTNWRIKGRRGAAELLGLKPSTLYSRINKLGIPNRPKRDDISS